MSPLRWTCKSLRRLAAELARLRYQVSHTVVGEMLKAQKFSLQGNRKTREGGEHPDRDAQFAHLNARVTTALAERQPVISVDTKKKELVGDFKNAGRTWRPQGEPEEVRADPQSRPRQLPWRMELHHTAADQARSYGYSLTGPLRVLSSFGIALWQPCHNILYWPFSQNA